MVQCPGGWNKHVIRENERKQSTMPNGGRNIAYLDSRVQIDTYASRPSVLKNKTNKTKNKNKTKKQNQNKQTKKHTDFVLIRGKK